MSNTWSDQYVEGFSRFSIPERECLSDMVNEWISQSKANDPSSTRVHKSVNLYGSTSRLVCFTKDNES